MLKPILNLKFASLLLLWGALSLTFPVISFAQTDPDCLGTSGVITGTISNVGIPGYGGGYPCALEDQLKYALGDPLAGAQITISAQNVKPTVTEVQFVVNWGDGTGQGLFPTKDATGTWTASAKHPYPVAGPTVLCEYQTGVVLMVRTNPADPFKVCTSFGNPPLFSRWNVDTENSGKLSLSSSDTNEETYYVCEGTETNVTFTDRSTYNCMGNTLQLSNTQYPRWRQFIYGTSGSNISGVKLDGIVHGYPFPDGVVDNSGALTSNVIPPDTYEITIPSTATAGQEFYITMNYWNACNKYTDAGSVPVTKIAKIVVISQPAAPSPVNVKECGAGPTSSGFSITGVPANSAVHWYANSTSGVDAPAALLRTTPSGTLTFAEALMTITPGVYKVWASYKPASSICESQKVLVQYELVVPSVTATAAADQKICDQLTSLSLGTNAAEAGTWSIKSQPASSIVNFSPSINDPLATATVNVPGVYVFTWTVVDGICTVSDEIQVVYDNKPSAPNPSVFSTQTCASSLMLTASAVDKNGTGQWSIFSLPPLADPVMIVPINAAQTTVSQIPIGTTVLTWTVLSEFKGCPDQTADYTIVRDPLPDVSNSLKPLCEDVEGSGTAANVVLSTYDGDVTNTPGCVVNWAIDQAHINSNTFITRATITTGLSLSFRITNPVTHCYVTKDVSFSVVGLPLLANQTAGYCESSKGSNECQGIDLAQDFNAKITSNNPALLVKRWFDNSTGIPNQIPKAGYRLVGSAALLAEVQNLVTGCINMATVNLSIVTRPVDNPILLSDGSAAPSTLKYCTSNDIVVLHLDPTLNPGSTYSWNIPSQYEVVGGGSPAFYVLLRFKTAQPLRTITVQEFKGSGCSGNQQSVNVVVEEPALTGPALTGDLQVCTNQQGATYSVVTPSPGATYSWQVPNDAFIIGDKTASSIQVLWGTTDGVVRAQENTSGGCTSPLSTPVSVHVNTRPVVNSLFPQVCADDVATMMSLQNLDSYQSSINNSGSVSYRWYEDRDLTHQITSLINYPVTNSTVLYGVVDNGVCDNTAKITFTVSAFYPGVIEGTQSVCTGSTAFILTNLTSPVSGVSGSYAFQWQSSVDNFVTLASVTDIPLATDITYDPGAVSSTLYYRRKVSIGNCVPKFTTSVKVTALPIPTGDFGFPAQLCANDADAKLNFNFNSDGPFKFDYNDDKGNSFTNVMGSNFTSVGIPGLTESTTYTLTKVQDVNKCVALLNTSHTVQVLKVNADFTIDLPLAKCSEDLFTFHWNVDPNVTYTWLWGDGQSTVINANTVTGAQSQQHGFKNASATTVFNYPVQFSALADNGVIVCEAKPVIHNIAVNPTVQPVVTGKQVVCSDEEIQFNNLSVGANTSEWYVDGSLVGTTNGNDPFSYTFDNVNGLNPQTYTLLYRGINAYCPRETTLNVQVYKSVNATFDYVQTKEFSGYATEKFTNTSAADLTDPSVQYSWSFGNGNDATPGSYVGTNTELDVNYATPGYKYITLKAVNTAKAECVSEKQVQINIFKPALSGDFKVTPLVACLPVDLIVDNGILGADAFEWSLIETTKGEVATSNSFEPVFRISNAGEYEIDLTVMLNGDPSYYRSKKVTIFDLPLIGFLPNPSVVSIPDVAVHVINQTSNANKYLWDFGDNTTSTDSQPVHAYLEEGDYTITLTAMNDHGDYDIGDNNTLVNVTCSNTGTQSVKAIAGGSSLVPNAFTPSKNGPGSVSNDPRSNDYFLPLTEGVEEFEMEVFDRWGTLLFITKDKLQGWDGYDRNGKALAAGVYVYKLTMRLSNGQRTTQIGDVTLLR